MMDFDWIRNDGNDILYDAGKPDNGDDDPDKCPEKKCGYKPSREFLVIVLNTTCFCYI